MVALAWVGRQFDGRKGNEIGLTVDGAEACESREVAGSQEPVPNDEAGIPEVDMGPGPNVHGREERRNG